MRTSRRPRRVTRLRYERRSNLTVEVSQAPCRFRPRPHFYRSNRPHQPHTLGKNLAPVKEGGGKLEDGKFKDAIVRDFGSVERFKKQFNAATVGIQGSGWGWLWSNPTTNILDIVTTPNQDHLL